MKGISVNIAARLLLILLVFVASAGCEQKTEKAAEPAPFKGGWELSETTVLATIEKDEMPVPDDFFRNKHKASDHAEYASPQGKTTVFNVWFNSIGNAVAYLAFTEKGARIVHNGTPGGNYELVSNYTLSISPDGRSVAYGAYDGRDWYMVVDDRPEGPYNSVGPAVFSPDSRHLIYEARTGDTWRLVMDGMESRKCLSYYDKPVFSRDSSRLFYIENIEDFKRKRLVVSDLEFNVVSSLDFRGALVVLNDAGTRVAAADKVDGGYRVLEFSLSSPDKVSRGPVYDEIQGMFYGPDNKTLAYIASRDGKRYVDLNGRVQQLPDHEIAGPLVIKPDGKDAGILMRSRQGDYFLHNVFSGERDEKGRFDKAEQLTFSPDGRNYAYIASREDKWFVVTGGNECKTHDRVVTPRFSPDGRHLIYRAREDGRRFVVVADQDCRKQREHDSYELVFPVEFTDDGKSVAYGIKEGRSLIWKVEALD